MAKAKPEEAQLILQMYDLRRESVMRAARKYVVSEMWPLSYDEFKTVITGYGTEPNAYFRQVMTYWNMVCAMVLRGAVGEQLFYETQTEPYFLWAKFGEHIAQARKDQIDPEFLSHMDKLMSKPAAKKRVKALRERIAARVAHGAHAAAAKAGKS
ncbi:MAG TPA: hypothetical protein VHA06_24115 [Candidatus Angelobacter sp.]|jgi:hypothetical protein|nr:hypothetical protein [Candidatus Angelobacter sp.]